MLSEILFSKDEILPFVTTWVDLESIKLREISQMEKDRNWPSWCGSVD